MRSSEAADRERLAGAALSLERRPPYAAQAVRLPGRLTMQYVEQGRGDAVPVVALHGVTDSWRSFEPILPHLPATLHFFALTQRGHGDSEAPASGYALVDFADDVVAFLDAQRLERAVIVGHSMGSANARGRAVGPTPRRGRFVATFGCKPNGAPVNRGQSMSVRRASTSRLPTWLAALTTPSFSICSISLAARL